MAEPPPDDMAEWKPVHHLAEATRLLKHAANADAEWSPILAARANAHANLAYAQMVGGGRRGS